MTKLYSILVFLLTSVSMLSGLIIAPIGTLILSAILLAKYKKLDFSRIKTKKLEIILFGWLFLSCIWSISEFSAFTKFLTVLFFFFAIIIVSDLSLYEGINRAKIFGCPMILGCITAIIIFVIEYSTNGFLTREFRAIFQKSGNNYFAINFLDRGCAVLSMISWPLMFLLAKQKRWFSIVAYAIVAGYILKTSDSLASYLAFILGIATLMILLVSRMYGIYLLMIGVLAAGVFLPIFAYRQIPREICHTYQSKIPDSGKHRLFIWKFTAEKAMEKQLFGWGFDASHNIPMDEENDMIYFNQYKWNPLPLHPHNNFMQIWLEGGLVGLGLWVLLLVKMLFRIRKISKKDSDIVWGSFAGACFMNYFFISMISFGLWQIWWITTICMVIFFFSIFRNLGQIEDKEAEELEKI